MLLNIPKVLERATGTLRKLTNDTIIYKPSSLSYMLDIIEKNQVNRPQIYFLNSGRSTVPLKINTLEEYINTLTYHLTWVGSVALWDDDCSDLSLMVNNHKSDLPHVPYLLSNFEKHKSAFIYDKILMYSITPQKKNISYGLYRVFYVNFLNFIKIYLDNKKITKQCYENVRKTLLLDFFCVWIVNEEIHSDKFLFSNSENLKASVDNAYKDESYFCLYKLKLIYIRLKMRLKDFLKWIGKK